MEMELANITGNGHPHVLTPLCVKDVNDLR